MNSYCMNCLGEHPPALCPQKVKEPLADAAWVTREINLQALAYKRDTPNTMTWRQRFEDDDPEATPPTTSNIALVERLGHRFALPHAVALEAKLGNVLERARKQRKLGATAAARVDELIGQSDAVLTSSARDRISRARRFLEAARELDPLDPRIGTRLGFTLAEDGRRVQAAEVFAEVASTLPQGLAPALRGSALLLASRAYFLANQQKQAWEKANEAERFLPNDGAVHYQKALVATRYSQADRSVKLCLRRAIDLDPAYFTLAALDPTFDTPTWNQVVRPLLQELEDLGVQGLLEQREQGRELFRELEDLTASPGFPMLPSTTGGGPDSDRDGPGETRALLGQMRELFDAVDSSLEKGPARRVALEGQLHAAQQSGKSWILAWQRALLEHVKQQIGGALPGEGETLPPGAGKPLERLVTLAEVAQELEDGVGNTQAILNLEESVARELRSLELLRQPEPRARPQRTPTWRSTMGRVVFYLAVMLSVLAAFGADLLVLHSQSFAEHPFWATLGAAALTAYLPELVARLTRPSEGTAGSWGLHDLAFLPAYLVFPILPAAGVVHAIPTQGMFMLMMAVSALMSLLLIIGLTGRRG